MSKDKKSLGDQFKQYKQDGGEAPVYKQLANVKINEGGKKVILSLEEKDRDGETVMIDGIMVRDKELGIPMIDSHKMNDSVVENGLGAVRNIRKEMIDGKAALVGEPDFAPTPRGKIAEMLYMGAGGGKPYFSNVSIGFSVLDYNNETKEIPQSEVFELSLVTVGANYGARFVSKGVKDLDKKSEDVAKKLARFEQIHPAFKEFTNLFLSENFCKMIGYEKDGDLLIDINNVYDEVVSKYSEVSKEEAPQETEEAPQEDIKDADIKETTEVAHTEPTEAQIKTAILNALDDAISRKLS